MNYFSKKKIGLIAGNGNFPLITLENAKKAGYEVYVCAIKGEADQLVADLAHICTWVKLGQIRKVATFFLNNDVHECIMAGKITKTNVLKGHVFPDLDMIALAATLKDWKDDSLLGSICSYLEKRGIVIMDSTYLLGDLVAKEQVYSKKKPSKAIVEDIEFGWQMAKEMGRLDIGQAVIVKNKAVLAVEAIEGTDAAIRRAGDLGGSGSVIVKVAKPQQDMRFDVPVVGLRTLDNLIACGAKALVVEAGKTIILDPVLFVEKIDREKIVFVGRKDKA
ncbi:MAG: UDP-2,3-diacylglucosamine diphosphatase LpxI [Candidatus Omnitrophica bacterium]|nr:UDP-2,3-diacylglucosamine diphosphatase LpxI [Candidatus Omnitrophota bacterium]